MYRRRSRRNEERRKAIFIVIFKVLLVAAAFAVTAYYAYETGVRVTQSEAGMLQDRLAEASGQIKGVEEQLSSTRAALAAAQKDAAETKALYEQVKPSDDVRDLMASVRSRLAAGVNPKRLSLVIKSAENRHDCQALPVKRFAVRTPRYKGPAESTRTRVGDLAFISVDGAGANGGLEQWFDPEGPVVLHISANGLKDREVQGRLPLEDGVMVRGAEVHFTVSASANRGFVEVAGEKCGL